MLTYFWFRVEIYIIFMRKKNDKGIIYITHQMLSPFLYMMSYFNISNYMCLIMAGVECL
jgi:hypothetical protein